MEQIKLKNGSSEAGPLVTVTMMSLDNLLTNHVTAFYDFVMICRSANHHPMNPRYKPFGNNGKVLRDLLLINEDGTVHDSIKNIALSAVKGDGLEMSLGNPRA